MGVRGLSSFFANNPHLFQNYKLCETRVIVDGLNLCYYLYLNSKTDYVYGGDYDKFAQLVADYFGSFLRCGIKAIVVLDGAIDASGRKIRTIRDRVVKRLSIAKQISKSGYAIERILPILAVDVFKDVLEDLGVQLYQCDHEADEQIAAFAKYFDCPVLSMDSDFYIFDIPAGFIKLDSLDMASCERNVEPYIDCSIFYIHNFLAHFPGLKGDVLPLFGTVMGNDYVDISVFDTFFDHIQLSKRAAKSLRATRRHARMVALLQWLQNKKVESALDRILMHLKKDVRECVSKLVKDIIEGYTDCCRNAERYMTGSLLAQHTKLVHKNGSPVPTWFVQKHRSAQLASFLANVIVSQKVFLECQVEDVNRPSANECSSSLRNALYSILLCSDSSSSCKVEEYDRKDTSLKCTKIEVTKSTGLPNFITLPDTPVNEKLDCLLNLLSCDKSWLCVFPESWQLLMACVQFVVRFGIQTVTDEFLSSVLLSCILLSFKESLHTACDSLSFKVEIKEFQNARKNMEKYFRKPQHNHAKVFLTRIVHSYSQLQSCIKFASNLNSLFGNPLPKVRVDCLLNGSFIYTMTCNLEGRVNPRLYISEALGRGTELDSLYSYFKQHLLDFIEPDTLAKVKTKTREKRLKKKMTGEARSKDFSILDTDVCG